MPRSFSQLHARRQLAALVEVGEDMQARSPRTAGSLAFYPRPLLQVNLPYRTVPGHVFERRAGRLRLRVEAPEHIGLPYGRYPRLLLTWLATEAVRTRSPRLELGDSLSAFLRHLGITASGGDHGPIRRVRDQMKRLFSAGITTTWESDEDFAVEKLGIVRRAQLWWDSPRPDRPVAAGSVVRLSDDFFRVVTEAQVPVDLRAVRALRSAMAIDVYLWLSYRTFTLRGRPTWIRWQTLQQQFGSQSARLAEFRRQFRQALAKVRLLCPCLRVNAGDAQRVQLLPRSEADSAPS